MNVLFAVGEKQLKNAIMVPDLKINSNTYKPTTGAMLCKECGYTGPPTTYGGQKVGRPYYHLLGFPPGYKVINSKVDEKCPRCKKNWK